MLARNLKVIIAGSTGLVGRPTTEKFRAEGHEVVEINSKVLNLLEKEATNKFILTHKPDIVIDAAARVGGIVANSKFPYEFISENLQIQSNLMEASVKAEVPKFVFLGSSCIYPRDSAQPIKEEYLLTGPLEESNSAYAIAKIAGIETVKSVRKEFGYDWISLMPTNVYGPNDNFNLETAHVLPALIRKFVEAVESGRKEITLWGSGDVTREFIYSLDLANAIYFATLNYNNKEHINIGTGYDLSIRDLALLISDLTNYQGDIFWDAEKPDGTPKKLLDISKIEDLGWSPEYSLRDGLIQTIDWFKAADKVGGVRK